MLHGSYSSAKLDSLAKIPRMKFLPLDQIGSTIIYDGMLVLPVPP